MALQDDASASNTSHQESDNNPNNPATSLAVRLSELTGNLVDLTRIGGSLRKGWKAYTLRKVLVRVAMVLVPSGLAYVSSSEKLAGITGLSQAFNAASMGVGSFLAAHALVTSPRFNKRNKMRLERKISKRMTEKVLAVAPEPIQDLLKPGVTAAITAIEKTSCAKGGRANTDQTLGKQKRLMQQLEKDFRDDFAAQPDEYARIMTFWQKPADEIVAVMDAKSLKKLNTYTM